MGSKNNPANRRRSPLSIIIVFGLCCFFYLLGTWQKSGFGKGDSIAMDITKKTECEEDFSTLDFHPHHNIPIPDSSKPKSKTFKPCDVKYTDYTPCHEQDRAMRFPRENMVYRERHCPPQEEKLKCLIPAPKGYSTPFPWPKGRDYVHYANVPFKHLTVEKANQHWVEYQGNVFKFPGGGTMFPQGADAYIDELSSVIPIADGSVRTALDTGCGVASWGAYLMKRNVLAMSFAPRDNHEAQVQFALERGVPAIIGVLGSIKLPFPSRAFDMAQCSRCLIPWGENDGKYLMEVDRVLRPGGFWILSGPPINWKTYYQTWKRSKEDLRAEQRKIEKLAESLCWEKKYEKGDIAIWRKKVNPKSCKINPTNFCKSTDTDNVWYKKMETCVTPYPIVKTGNEVAVKLLNSKVTKMGKSTATTKDDAQALFRSLHSAYSATPTNLKIIDLYVVFAVFTALIQVGYMAIVGSFPFNSFLSGVLSCVGTAVLAVCLRIQVNKENKEFKDLPPERAFADFVLCNLVLHLVIMNFLG